MFGVFWTNGQICSSTSRLLLEESVAPAFLARLAEATAAIPLCEPLQPEFVVPNYALLKRIRAYEAEMIRVAERAFTHAAAAARQAATPTSAAP